MNIKTHTDNGSLEAVVTWEEPVVHGGDDDLWVRSSHQPGESFPIGQTQVQYVVFDPTNETVTDCQFQIDVIGRIQILTICVYSIMLLDGVNIWDHCLNCKNTTDLSQESRILAPGEDALWEMTKGFIYAC